MINRKQQMLEMRESMTLADIGIFFGISRERVRQIIGTGTGKGVWRENRHREVLSHPELTNKELARLTGYTEATVSAIRGKTRHAIREGSLKKGVDVENNVSMILNSRDISHQLTPYGYIYDIRLDNGKTVDVKSSYGLNHPPSSIGEPYYQFRVSKENYCDYFIFVVVPEEKYYIVPAWDAKENNRITTGTAKSVKWTKYLDRWELLK